MLKLRTPSAIFEFKKKIIERKFIIIPVYRATGHNNTGLIEINPKHEADQFYYLYYSDLAL